MTKKQWKIVLWIIFTALFFGIFCGISYLISHSIDLPSAIFFFVILGLLDKKGVAYLVDYYLPKVAKGEDGTAGSKNKQAP